MTEWHRFDIRDGRLVERTQRDVDEEGEKEWLAELKADRNAGWRCMLDIDRLLVAQARRYKHWFIVYVHPELLK